ncbi:MAG: hypothetical protein VB824_02125 [Dehalococcoidia bacterium]
MAEERMETHLNIDSSESSRGQVTAEDRLAFEAAGVVAIAFAEEDRTPYGGPMARRELSFNVIETQRLGGDIRVRIGYWPSKRFSGRAGEEWILVSPDGVVRARELISRPKENKPWVLIALAAISVIAALVLVPVLIDRSDPSGDPLYRAGRTLYMRASQPEIMDQVQYQGMDIEGVAANFQITGPGNGWKLAVIDVTLWNETSQQVSVAIDENAAVLIDVDGDEHPPIDVVARSQRMTEPIDSRYLYPDFIGLWRSIVIRGSETVGGKLLFEVPPDFEADRLTWKASDTIQVGFRD